MMNETALYACTLLLSEPASGKRALFTHFTIASNDHNALSIATSMAQITFQPQGGDLMVDDYILSRVDRETLEAAAENILGWQPAPQEIEGEQ